METSVEKGGWDNKGDVPSEERMSRISDRSHYLCKGELWTGRGATVDRQVPLGGSTETGATITYRRSSSPTSGKGGSSYGGLSKKKTGGVIERWEISYS